MGSVGDARDIQAQVVRQRQADATADPRVGDSP
jgi:hypothetical protein